MIELLVLVLVVSLTRPETIKAQVPVNQSFNRCVAVTPSDTVDQPLFTQAGLVTGAIYIGGVGNIAAVFQDTSVGTFTAPVLGTFLPLAVRRINATNTTATLLLACYRT